MTIDKKTMFEDVKEFHRFFGHSIGRKPKFLTEERFSNRLKWQDEERKEFIDAINAKDITEAADALVDQVYFILGTAVEMGIPFDHVWELVHKANMAKSYLPKHLVDCPLHNAHEVPIRCDCGAVKYKEDGKTAKPEGWEAPDGKIRWLLTQLDNK